MSYGLERPLITPPRSGGTCEGTQVVVAAARGKYDAASGLEAYNYEIPYLRHILGFIGILT